LRHILDVLNDINKEQKETFKKSSRMPYKKMAFTNRKNNNSPVPYKKKIFVNIFTTFPKSNRYALQK
jgi:hypothetical protein